MLAIGSIVVTLLIVVWAWPQGGDAELSAAEAVLLGVVEGVTEFLPVSSTGHLSVTNDLLGLTDTPAAEDAANAYAIVIQAGAIVAVLGIYWRRVLNAALAIFGRGEDPQAGRNLLFGLIGGFIPAAVLGLFLSDLIKEYLFGIWPVVAAWIVFGVVILLWRNQGGSKELEIMSFRDGLMIGAAQTLALWPGTSRSLVTILAALAIGYSMASAVEFSFLLGLATLGAATVYESLDSGSIIVDTFGFTAPAIGFVAAFVSAAIAVKWMVAYLQSRSLAIFGWYRIGIGVAVGALALAGLV